MLKAKGHISAGREIRVDYDMGVVGRPFREQMIKRGVAESELEELRELLADEGSDYEEEESE